MAGKNETKTNCMIELVSIFNKLLNSLRKIVFKLRTGKCNAALRFKFSLQKLFDDNFKNVDSDFTILILPHIIHTNWPNNNVLKIKNSLWH